MPATGEHIWVGVLDDCVDHLDQCLSSLRQLELACKIAEHPDTVHILATVHGIEDCVISFDGYLFSYGRDPVTGHASIFKIDADPDGGPFRRYYVLATKVAVAGTVLLFALRYYITRMSYQPLGSDSSTRFFFSSVGSGKSTLLNAWLASPAAWSLHSGRVHPNFVVSIHELARSCPTGEWRALDRELRVAASPDVVRAVLVGYRRLALRDMLQRLAIDGAALTLGVGSDGGWVVRSVFGSIAVDAEAFDGHVVQVQAIPGAADARQRRCDPPGGVGDNAAEAGSAAGSAAGSGVVLQRTEGACPTLRGLNLEIHVGDRRLAFARPDYAMKSKAQTCNFQAIGEIAKACTTMTNRDFDREQLLRRAMADLRAHISGELPMRSFKVPKVPTVDVRAIRERLNDTVEQFAARLGVSRDLVITWECGEGELDPDVCRLLVLLEQQPDEVTRELAMIRAQIQ
jgi:hypothetical protein